jgi:hypothetical protein
MSIEVEKHSPVAVEPAEVQQTLDRVLNSRHFVNAHKKKAFLRLICDLYVSGRAHEVNEYRLAFDVFGRDSSYNPSADPIVRVVAHEIRKKLELYYQTEGANDDIRLEIPAGSYQPIFTRHAPATVEAEHAPPADDVSGSHPAEPSRTASGPPPGRQRVAAGVAGLSIAVLILTIAVVVLAFSNRELRQRTAGADAEATPVGGMWTTFLSASTPPLSSTRVILTPQDSVAWSTTASRRALIS